MAATSSPRTTPKASWCARPRPRTTRRRTRTRSRPATWCGSRCSPATTPGAQKADRLIEGVLGAAGENLIGHAALLNALDLRLRGAEIVITGSGERADALTRGRAKALVPRPHRAARARCRRPARRASGARQDRRRSRRRRVRLRRRALFPARHDRRTARRSRPRDGGAASSRSKLESLPGSGRSPKLTQILEDAHARLASRCCSRSSLSRPLTRRTRSASSSTRSRTPTTAAA